MEYLNDEQKERIQMNNEYITIAEDIKSQREQQVKSIKKAFDDIKNTISPSPWKIAGDFIRNVTDEDPAMLITRTAFGSMIKGNIRDRALKNIGMSITGEKPVQQKTPSLGQVEPVLMDKEAHTAIYKIEAGSGLTDDDIAALNEYVSKNSAMIPETIRNILLSAGEKEPTESERKIVSEWHEMEMTRTASEPTAEKGKKIINAFILAGGLILLKLFLMSFRR